MFGQLPLSIRWLGALAWLLGGCASIPPGRSAIDQIDFEGAERVDEEDLAEKIATRESPKFAGLFRGVVYDYETLDRVILQRDLARIERQYRARGFYEAHARAARVISTGTRHVRVEFIVEEGPPVVVSKVEVQGIASLPTTITTPVHEAAATMRVGQPFDETRFASVESTIQRALTDRGYAFAKVTREASVDLVRHEAKVVFTATPDRPATLGKVILTGLGELPEAPIRRALDLREGAPYSTQELDDARQAAMDLGVLASIEVTPELPDPPPESRVVPVKIKVEPTRLRSILLGGGVELDALKTDVHLLAGWESKNFFGGLRTFSVTFKPGVVLYPLRTSNFVAPDRLLFEERLRLELEQPGFIEARTNGFIRPEINAYPVLLRTETAPEDPVLGYREGRAVVGVDRTFWRLYASLAQNVMVENPFTYSGALDPALRTLVLSYPALFASLDLRDDKVRPREGVFVGNELQIAGLGGHARDVKVQPEIRGYVPLARGLTLAARSTVGFLFPQNYGDIVRHHLSEPVTAENRAERVRDLQVVYFRGFFSGGPSSNRGYPLQSIAPHGVVPFLTPAVEAQRVAQSCTPDSADYDAARCAIPIGGFSLWEASLEVRVDLNGPLSSAVFCDASDVSAQMVSLRLNYPHLSCGVGLRYDTPVGPIRLDVGYRIPGLQYPSSADPREEGDPGDFFGAPIALAFGIGEAF